METAPNQMQGSPVKVEVASEMQGSLPSSLLSGGEASEIGGFRAWDPSELRAEMVTPLFSNILNYFHTFSYMFIVFYLSFPFLAWLGFCSSMFSIVSDFWVCCQLLSSVSMNAIASSAERS